MRTLGVKVQFADNADTLKQHMREGLSSVDDFANSFRKYKDAAAQALNDSVNRLGAVAAMSRAADAEVNKLRRDWAAANSDERRNVIAQQLGEAMVGAQALRKELEKTRGEINKTLNIDTPADAFGAKLTKLNGLLNMFGVGLSVSAVIGFGKALLDDAAALTKLHDQTQISIRDLQVFQTAGDDAGNTLEQITSAASMLQKRLGAGEDSTVAALQRLGLNLENLKRMDPGQAFKVVAERLRDVKNANDQANLATETMGRGAIEILPTIKRGFDDIADSAGAMSEEAVGALEKMGDEIERYWRRAKRATGEGAGDIARIMQREGFALGLIANPIALRRELEKNRAETLDREVQQGFKTLTAATPSLSGALTVPGMPTKDQLRDIDAALEIALAKSRPAMRKEWSEHERAVKRVEEAYKEARQALIPLTEAQAAEARELLKLQLPFETIAAKIGAAAIQVRLFDAALDQRAALRKIEMGGGAVGPLGGSIGLVKPGVIPPALFDRIRAIEMGGGPVGPLGGAFGLVKPNAKEDLRGLVGPLNTTLRDLASQGPQLIVNALTGGGGLRGALGAGSSMFGSSLMSNVFGAPGAASGLLKGMTGLLGTTLSSAMPIIGGLIGPLIGKFFGKTTEESLRVNQPREEFVQGFGGLGSLNQRVQAATGSLGLVQKLLGAKTERDYEAAVKAIELALEGMTQKMDAATTSARSIQDRLKALTDISPELQAALDQIYDAQNPDAYARAVQNVTDLLDAQEQKQNRINNTLAELGIEWTEAGESVKKARIGEESDKLVQKFKDLKDAEVDINRGMRALGPSLSEFVETAKKAGVEVPEAMREVLQVSIDAGSLLDENGEKYKTLQDTGLKFAEKTEPAMKKVETAVDKLASAIDRLDRTLRGLPPETNVDVNVNRTETTTYVDRRESDEPRYESPGGPGEAAATGALVMRGGLRRFGGGGMVGRWTPPGWHPPGADTELVWTTPGELIMTDMQQERVANLFRDGALMAAALTRGTPEGKGSLALVVVRPPDAKPETMADAALAAFPPAFKHDRHGIRTVLVEAFS